ncbi:MAG: hypothetical protein ACI39R_05835 [Lachnospiraceae bacterium]
MKKDKSQCIDRVEVADEKRNRERRTKNDKFHRILRWWPLPVYIILVIVLIIFIKSGDEDDLYKASYTDTTDKIMVGDTCYVLLSKEEQDSYIGSFVSDKLNAIQKDKVASIRSYLLYVSVFFSVEGDPEMDYLMDGKNTIYIKEELLQDAKSYYADSSNIEKYKMTGKKKDLDTMNELSDEQMEMLNNLSGEEVIIKDQMVTENYETRREIFGFYDNGIMYQAVMELFIYNNEIYKTTMIIDGDDNQGVTVIRGIKLPEEYQKEFMDIWN